MKLSTRGKYGLYAMYHLARHAGEGPQSLQSMGTTGVPMQYLERLLGSLRRAGLVSTVRGAQGGYQLAREPAEVTLLDIIDAVEGPVEWSACVGVESACGHDCQCPVRRVWQNLTDTINNELRAVTLQSMLSEPDSALCGADERKNPHE